MASVDAFANDLGQYNRRLRVAAEEADEDAAKMAAKLARKRARRRSAQAGFVAPTIVRRGSTVVLGVRKGPNRAARRSAAALGAEMGAKAWPQFPRYRGRSWDRRGYFYHPAIREVTEDPNRNPHLEAAEDTARKTFR